MPAKYSTRWNCRLFMWSDNGGNAKGELDKSPEHVECNDDTRGKMIGNAI